MSLRRFRVPALCALLSGSLWQLGGAGYIHVKAAVAQTLLHDAWAQTLLGARQVAPWPWADTWPVARLRVPQHARDLIVLAGASGRSLAFAPGQLSGSAGPGDAGRMIIAGHRDTHFAFLRELRAGDELQLQDPGATVHRFRVSSTRVVDSRSAALSLDGPHELVLVTCFPFDAMTAGGPLRYLVFAAAAGSVRDGQISPQFGYRESAIRTAERDDSRI